MALERGISLDGGGLKPALRTIGRARPVRPQVQVAEGQSIAVSWREDLALFLFIAIPTAALGIWAAVGLHIFYLDNLARINDALQVIYGFEPKLSNIGFIWAPLPALIQMPLVVLLKGLAFHGATGPIVSCAAGGVCLLVLNRILALYIPGKTPRYVLLALYQANPLVLYLMITGLSEMLLLMFVLLGWLAFQRLFWEEPLPFVQVGIMGTAMAGAVLSRYEGIPFAMALGAALPVMVFLQKRPGRWNVTEALTLAYLTPWSYAFAVWLFFNFMIMGNALHFASGKGSHSEHARNLLAREPSLAALVGDLPASALHAMNAAWDVVPVFIPMLPVALTLVIVRRDLLLFGMIMGSLSFTAAQGVLYFTGGSLGWLRYHVYLAAFAPMLLGYCLRKDFLPLALPRVPGPVIALAGAGLVAASTIMTWRGLDDPAFIIDGETTFLQALVLDPSLAAPYQRRAGEVGFYLRDELFRQQPDALVLLDDQQADEIILYSAHPGRFVVPGTSCFQHYLDNPTGNVTHLLVPPRVTVGSDLILQAYPDLYEKGAPFARMEREFETPTLQWRLFRVQGAGDGPVPSRCTDRPGASS